MADYRDRLEEWREAARKKARELDERFEIRNRVEESARAATEAARRSADAVGAEAKRARHEAERFSEDFELTDHARRAADEARHAAEEARRLAEEATRRARDTARDAGDAFRSAARASGEKANEVFDNVTGEARGYYERASQVYDVSARATRTATAVTGGFWQAQKWVRDNPGKAALTTFSIVAGIRTGAAFPGLDKTFLGAHPHWFTHSALPVYALRKIGDKFDSYLQTRERLVANGDLTTVERERLEFQRQAVKLVGAPLLGAFSCAAGFGLWAQIFRPERIVGAPVSWLLGGNPVLDGIWLFANGVVCFQQGYKFFMIALRDNKDATRIVRELRGLLPEASSL